MGEINLYKMLVIKFEGRGLRRRLVDGIDADGVSGCEVDYSVSQFAQIT
jgi:hypothetical protein